MTDRKAIAESTPSGQSLLPSPHVHGEHQTSTSNPFDSFSWSEGKWRILLKGRVVTSFSSFSRDVSAFPFPLPPAPAPGSRTKISPRVCLQNPNPASSSTITRLRVFSPGGPPLSSVLSLPPSSWGPEGSQLKKRRVRSSISCSNNRHSDPPLTWLPFPFRTFEDREESLWGSSGSRGCPLDPAYPFQ